MSAGGSTRPEAVRLCFVFGNPDLKDNFGGDFVGRSQLAEDARLQIRQRYLGDGIFRRMTVLTGRPLPRFHRFDRRRRENFGKAHEFLLQAIEILQGDDKLALRATGAQRGQLRYPGGFFRVSGSSHAVPSP
jgi:hypothetical protein